MLYKILDSITFWGVVALFFLLLVGTIFLLKAILAKQSQKLISQNKTAGTLTKKFQTVDINKFGGLIANIGLVLSLAFVLTAFEFPDFEAETLCKIDHNRADLDILLEVPPIINTPPPAPKIRQPKIVEVPTDEEIEEEIEVTFEVEVSEEDLIESIEVENEHEEVVDTDLIVDIAEVSAAPIGGYEAFYKYVKKNIKYPTQAKRIGVEGKVYVQFVVDKEGKVTDVKAIRGIGGGCDEEAVRILELAPNWKPAKQRGRPVRQRIVIPISFRLG